MWRSADGGTATCTLLVMGLISYGRRLTTLAERDPDRLAITCGEHSLTRGELESAANRMARDLAAGGVGFGDMVTIALPNSTDWYVAFGACWKIGAIPQPVSSKLPEPEIRAILALAGHGGGGCSLGVGRGTSYHPARLPARSGPVRRTSARCHLTSVEGTDVGRNPGRPKLIVSGDPGSYDEDVPPLFGTADGCIIVQLRCTTTVPSCGPVPRGCGKPCRGAAPSTPKPHSPPSIAITRTPSTSSRP